MQRVPILLVLVFGCPIDLHAEPVTITNLSGATLDVFLKESGSREYRTVAAGLFDSRRQRLNVTGFPFRIAVSKSPQRYSFLGPFARDPAGGVPDIKISRQDVFETRVGERWVFDCWTGRWVRKTVRYIVVRQVEQIEVRGLKGVGPYATTPLPYEAPVEPAQPAPRDKR